MLTRRALFGGLAALAAPAIIRTPGLLMPVRVPQRTAQAMYVNQALRWQVAVATDLAALMGATAITFYIPERYLKGLT